MINSLESLATLLNGLYPTRYSHFTNKQQTPFICFIDTGDDNFHADSTIHQIITDVDIELYVKEKDREIERNLELLLLQNNLIYDKSPTVYLNADDIYQTIYTIQLLEIGGN